MSHHDKDLIGALTACLRRHAGVEQAVVVSGGREPRSLVAYIVPDAHRAGEIRRACALEADGRLEGLSLHEPGADLLVAQRNRTETDFLYREIFLDNAYLRHGIELPERACIVDVGANIGMFSTFAAKTCKDARIVAIEPIAELSRAVRANAEIHRADITVLNCAMGSEAGRTDFTFYPNNTVMSGRFADAEDRDVLRAYLVTGEGAQDGRLLDDLVADRMVMERRSCEVMTLRQVVELQRIEEIDLLKIDVEKAEMDVLRGMDESTWAKVAQLVIEVHDIGGRLGDVLKTLAGRGFVVAHDCDARMVKTGCYTVYAHRAQGRRPAAKGWAPAPAEHWPSRRRLADDLRASIASQLPGHPLPERFVFVSALPAEASLREHAAASGAGSAPRAPEGSQGEVESRLAGIWRELFGEGELRHDTDFFELGGNSLTAVRLLARVEDSFGVDVLAPDDVFTASRLGDMAAAIDAALAARQAGGGAA
ncbi:uncharacterized protein SOCEGT47_016710 [Sorangium cellulosum]|uniref:Carrier domain-containing protein n=1 Tax=Sorangium cellulosum TaxID=56 RepID=A0A4V0ND25_SORCE|nr:FkbM family methyltransferase [Sorangium cellulosum]AUX21192.1 uncharacterized protein SOCEGT47_016710 [Sorangium cellulosum]